MKKTNFFFLISILLLSLPIACTSDKLPEPQVDDCDPSLAYNGAIKTIIDNSCAFTGCHVSGGDAPGDYATYAGLEGALSAGSFEDRVIVQRNMPIAPGELSAEDLELINCWFQAGFPEN